MNRLLASTCIAVVAAGSSAAAAQDTDISREVIDAFVTGETITSEGGDGGECVPTSDEEYMRTGEEVICSERNTFLILGGNNNAAPASRPAPAATNARPTRPASRPAPRPRPARAVVRIPERCAPTESESLNMCLTFGLGSANLTDRAKDQVRVFAASLLENNSTDRFVIAGHTDISGAEARNCELSQERAQSVVDFMVGLGVPAAQLQPVGFGQTNLQPNVSATDARNRRVEIMRGGADAAAPAGCAAPTAVAAAE